MKKTIVIILAVILTDCFLFCQPSNRFIKNPEVWASQYIEDTTVFIGVAEYTDPIASHILALTDAVQQYFAKRAIVSVSGKKYVNDSESVSESKVQFGYDVLDIFVRKSEGYFAAVKFDDNGRYNAVMNSTYKGDGTIETMDSHFMISGADEADGYVITMNSRGIDVNSNRNNTGYYSIEIKYVQKY